MRKPLHSHITRPKTGLSLVPLTILLALSTSSTLAQTPAQIDQLTPTAQQIVNTMVGNEADANDHRGHYFYLSQERSDRTGGHLWSESVAETKWGKVHYLLAEDGHSLTGDRLAQETVRVAGEASDPEAFRKSEQARIDDEQHAKQMLQLLPKAFFFDAPTIQGQDLRINFHPNPAYSPQSIEERVIQGMSGFVLIDRKQLRLHEVTGKLTSDVSIGFGFLATIHAGSNFSSVRIPLDGADWKTQALHTDINGRALLLKTIARQQQSEHSGFRKIPDNLSVADAVTMLERDPAEGTPHTR
jgi:hypothetical protein